MKEVSTTIKHKDKEYKLVFNLNVMEKIQDEYGTINKWGELTDGAKGEVNIKALVFGLTEMINEGIDIANEDNGTNDPLLSHKKVARILSEIGVDNATKELNSVVIESVKDKDADGKNE